MLTGHHGREWELNLRNTDLTMCLEFTRQAVKPQGHLGRQSSTTGFSGRRSQSHAELELLLGLKGVSA